MTLRRLDDWRARLSAELDAQRRVPFTWGSHDCAVGFACRVVEAITGEDLAAPYRGQYDSPLGALRILRESGALTLGDFVAMHLPEINPAFARLGDLCLVPSTGPIGQGLGMVDATSLIVMTESGHGRLPRAAMIRAFRVGE
ncbi:DUF6950 family protein [Paracoccus seriniphilus]|uniref:DUF6950 domain-containing protein n=1 Tax=Paracoccus seriniphilus TaxID=184748 RepID=A0A239Q425_9RHOB|nr:hypothetical protein [Paracoccus seriniphilus]SNT76707.1 hypothetical protein SAMN05444959_12514 [Paracoccus seriniphilus]